MDEIQWKCFPIMSPIGQEIAATVDTSIQIGLGPRDPVTGAGIVYWRITP